MNLSLIIPAYNEERLLGGTLAHLRRSLAPLDALGWRTELIVCDNNSTDATARIATEAGARVVFEPVNQIARARNRGAATATGEWLLFVDADSRPSPELLLAVAQEIEAGSTVAGGSTVAPNIDAEHARFGVRLLACGFVLLWNTTSRLTRWGAGSFVFCEAAAFRAIGGFDESYYAGEEIDFFRRMKRHARANGRRVAILTDYPLVTSARKMSLYSATEALKFLSTVILRPSSLKRREACSLWYDGRR